ncbi:MAG: heavy metal translocating P-type ATPase [Spirochaetota bacterium]
MFPVPLIIACSVAYAGRKIYKGLASPKKKDLSSHSDTNNLTNELTSIGKSVDDRIKAFNKEVDHCFPISAIALGLATAGSLFFHPLSIISVPISLYVSWPIFKLTIRSLFVEREVKSELLDVIAITSSLSLGYYVITALCNFVYFLALKVLNETRDSTGKKLINVFSKQPLYVWVLKDEIEVKIPFKDLQKNDVIVINTGEVIPADGTIIEGLATIDQHILTGEAQPYEKSVGDQVLAATVLLAGRIHVKVVKAGQETIAVQIGEILNNTSKYELSMQTRSQKLSDKFVIPTLATSAFAFFTLDVHKAIAIICANFTEVNRVVSPIGMLNFLDIASKNNLLVKDGRVLEMLDTIDTVVFDKTGTLTLNQFSLGNIHVCGKTEESDLLMYAAAAEYRQSHPIAKTIIKAAKERNLDLPKISESSYKIGYGIKVEINNQKVKVGSIRFMEMEKILIPEDIRELQQQSHKKGYSSIFVAVNDNLAGMLEMKPVIRPEAKDIVQKLLKRNLSLYIISGDHENPTKELAQELGIDNYYAGVLPHEKSELIEQLQRKGKSVCFIGDGINDSIALKKSNVSISLRGASTAATDTAQIILMDESIAELDNLFEISSDFNANQKKGLTAVFLPGVMCVSGIFFLHLGIFSTFIFYNISALAGLTNSMLPRLLSSKKYQPKALKKQIK